MKLKSNDYKYLSSSQYKSDLSDMLNEINRTIKKEMNEATVGSIFENNLQNFITNKFSLKNFYFEKENTNKDLGFDFEGRIDMVKNGLLVEYKKPSVLANEKSQKLAQDQLINYYTQLKDKFNITTMIITDGIKLSKISYVHNEFNILPFKKISINDLDEIIKSLVFSYSKKLTSRNITHDFGLHPNNITSQLANKLFNILLNDKLDTKTQMLFHEWKTLFHLSESDQGKNQDIQKRRDELSGIFSTIVDNTVIEYKALFALQTTYAIIIKLIACKTLEKVAYNNEITYFTDLTTVSNEELRSFLEKIEDGYSYSDRGIKNLLEGDFFSWYHLKEHWDYEIYNLFITLIGDVEEYSTFTFLSEHASIDVFKDLYIEIIPKPVRHSLGEYFTPSWLADSLIGKSIELVNYKEDWISVDPTCGSGVFISALINKIYNEHDITELDSEKKKKLLSSILNRVKGIDINPLSVLTARVSYMLSIAPLLDGVESFEIPIYLGDSAVVSKTLNVNGIECYMLDINTEKENIQAVFPISFVESEHFTQTMMLAQKLLTQNNVQVITSYLIQSIANYSLTNNELEVFVNNMCKSLVKLSMNNWDGIWFRIISNFMKAGSIRNCDIVVGNPPWIKWEFLPQNYAERLKSISIERHLFSGQNYMGAISLNICALIAHVNATYRLNKNGVLSFLMPKTMMTQDSYEGFRNFIINDNERFYLQYAVDWEKAGHPFINMKEPFLSYFYKRNKINYNNGIPLKIVNKKAKSKISSINQNTKFDNVIDDFVFSDGVLIKLDNNRSGFTFVNDTSQANNFSKIIGENEYKARSGVEFTPKEVYMLESISNSSNNYLFKNMKSKNTIHKVNQIGKLELETKFIFPLITGPNIERFTIEESNQYCIYPYAYNSTSSISINDLLIESPLLAKYLLNQQSVISKQSERSKAIAKGDDFYSLSKIGKYTYSPYKVVFRDNSKWRAAIANPVITSWNEFKTAIPAKHAPFISQTKSGRDITEEESYYICGILNAPVVESYIINTFSKRSFSINLNIKIPEFDLNNYYHNKMVDLTKQIIFEDYTFEELANEINDTYLNICNN